MGELTSPQQEVDSKIHMPWLRLGAWHPAGITGRIRGMKYKRADGHTVRPSLFVLDRTSTRVKRVRFAWERGKVTAS